MTFIVTVEGVFEAEWDEWENAVDDAESRKRNDPDSLVAIVLHLSID